MTDGVTVGLNGFYWDFARAKSKTKRAFSNFLQLFSSLQVSFQPLSNGVDVCCVLIEFYH